MRSKLAAAGVAVAAIAGGCAVAVTALTTPSSAPSGAFAATADVRLAVAGAPLPLDPAADVPTADQLSIVLNGLADPGVPFASKGYLVEGGIGRIEARAADGLMRKAVANGQVPLSFTIADIVPAGPGAATANVTASGPGMPPTTQNVLFVDQAGWKLSRSSATTVLGMFNS